MHAFRGDQLTTLLFAVCSINKLTLHTRGGSALNILLMTMTVTFPSLIASGFTRSSPPTSRMTMKISLVMQNTHAHHHAHTRKNTNTHAHAHAHAHDTQHARTRTRTRHTTCTHTHTVCFRFRNVLFYVFLLGPAVIQWSIICA